MYSLGHEPWENPNEHVEDLFSLKSTNDADNELVHNRGIEQTHGFGGQYEDAHHLHDTHVMGSHEMRNNVDDPVDRILGLSAVTNDIDLSPMEFVGEGHSSQYQNEHHNNNHHHSVPNIDTNPDYKEHQPEVSIPDINDQFFSPALSFQGTPLMSPHALAPTHMAHNVPTRVRAAGKVTKPSPSISRWRSSSVPELEELGDFNLGDPAMSFLDDMSHPQAHSQQAQAQPMILQSQTQPTSPVQSVSKPQSLSLPQSIPQSQQYDIDDKLQAALEATTNVVRRKSSASSGRASNPSSHRGSRASTPRIRPKIAPAASSTTSSPDIKAEAEPVHDDRIFETFNKSNYQNIVEGTHQYLGLSDAGRMATSLNSKRTVHKMAEKERRNRLTNAVTELASLIGPVSEPNNVTTSKAATVERATEYIRKLHARIMQLEKEKENRGP